MNSSLFLTHTHMTESINLLSARWGDASKGRISELLNLPRASSIGVVIQQIIFYVHADLI